MSVDKLKRLKSRVKARDGYWIEKLKLEFTKALGNQLRKQSIKQGKLAKNLDISPAYITKVMRGDENLTMESMVKLARAAGGRVHIHISNQHDQVNWVECSSKGTYHDFIGDLQCRSSEEGRIEKKVSNTRGRGALDNYVPA